MTFGKENLVIEFRTALTQRGFKNEESWLMEGETKVRLVSEELKVQESVDP